jgi:hypothetical protein
VVAFHAGCTCQLSGARVRQCRNVDIEVRVCVCSLSERVVCTHLLNAVLDLLYAFAREVDQHAHACASVIIKQCKLVAVDNATYGRRGQDVHVLHHAPNHCVHGPGHG